MRVDGLGGRYYAGGREGAVGRGLRLLVRLSGSFLGAVVL